MDIELVPDPGADDPASRAAIAALAREGLVDDVRPAASEGPWRRAGLQEAVERSVTPAGSVPAGHVPIGSAATGSAATGYVPPPRNTRGAPRA